MQLDIMPLAERLAERLAQAAEGGDVEVEIQHATKIATWSRIVQPRATRRTTDVGLVASNVECDLFLQGVLTTVQLDFKIAVQGFLSHSYNADKKSFTALLSRITSDLREELGRPIVREIHAILERDYGQQIPYSTFARWAKQEALNDIGEHKSRGRPTKLTTDTENNLFNFIELLHECGCPIEVEKIKDLAREYCLDPTWQPSDHWLRGFKKRFCAAKPGFGSVELRSSERNTLLWATETNEKWWFGVYQNTLLKLGLAKRTGNGNVAITKPECIIVADETQLGGDTRKAKAPKAKYLTKVQSLNGAHGRKVAPTKDAKKLTLYAGASMAGDPCVPMFVLARKTALNVAEEAKIQEALPLGPAFPKFDGHLQDKAVLTTGPGGGLTAGNSTKALTEWLKRLYPDQLGPEHQAKLLILDAHSSHHSYELITTLRDELNVHILFYMPNATSFKQFHDTHVFRDLKSKLTRSEKDLLTNDPGKISISQIDKMVLATQAVMQVCTFDKITTGFRELGLNPIDPAKNMKIPQIVLGTKLAKQSQARENSRVVIERIQHVPEELSLDPRMDRLLSDKPVPFQRASELAAFLSTQRVELQKSAHTDLEALLVRVPQFNTDERAFEDRTDVSREELDLRKTSVTQKLTKLCDQMGRVCEAANGLVANTKLPRRDEAIRTAEESNELNEVSLLETIDAEILNQGVQASKDLFDIQQEFLVEKDKLDAEYQAKLAKIRKSTSQAREKPLRKL